MSADGLPFYQAQVGLSQLAPSAVDQAARVLEDRRAASLAGEIPGHWLLDSPGLAGVLAMARRLARAPGAPVLIEGQRGSGVLELARLIHDADPVARTGRLRAMSAHLVSPSEMRGSVPHGTLFIEDVENLRPSGQEWIAELLACRTESSRRLRVIGGSRLSVGLLLRHLGLSQELVHALDVGRLVIPPLRDRTRDILPLAGRFLRHCGEWRGKPTLQFSEAAKRKLLAHAYPANVQELRNVVERAAALATSDEVSDEAIVLFDQLEAPKGGVERALPAVTPSSQDPAHLPTLADLERNYLVTLIRALRGRRTEMARAMGVSYPTVLKKIAHHRLDVRAIVDASTASVDAAD